VLSSLAGATRAPTALAGRIRTGGFGGEDGFRDVIAAEAPDLVLDATHPFAARISARTAAICAEIALPYLQILRDPWVEGPGDRWAHIDAEEDAFEHIEAGSRGVKHWTGSRGCLLPIFIAVRSIRQSNSFPFQTGNM
jgi:precorrin-6A/cobalt-precorrin-6A reductase